MFTFVDKQQIKRYTAINAKKKKNYVKGQFLVSLLAIKKLGANMIIIEGQVETILCLQNSVCLHLQLHKEMGAISTSVK